MRPLLYSRDALLSIREGVKNTLHGKLDRPTWHKLTDLNIARTINPSSPKGGGLYQPP